MTAGRRDSPVPQEPAAIIGGRRHWQVRVLVAHLASGEEGDSGPQAEATGGDDVADMITGDPAGYRRGGYQPAGPAGQPGDPAGYRPGDYQPAGLAEYQPGDPAGYRPGDYQPVGFAEYQPGDLSEYQVWSAAANELAWAPLPGRAGATESVAGPAPAPRAVPVPGRRAVLAPAPRAALPAAPAPVLPAARPRELKALPAPPPRKPGAATRQRRPRPSAKPSRAAGSRLRPPPLLIGILLVQAALAARLIRSNTAFQDEALYLWAGHTEWAHWLHGASILNFPTFFSGAPVIYPPLGALADSVGGLTGARLLSLGFMLGATAALWGVTNRLFGRRAAYLAAGLWAFLGPTQQLGAFATYDAMSLFLIALAAWCATGGRGRRDATRWMLGGACVLVLANATKYASALFDPTVTAMAFLTGFPPGGKAARRRAAFLLGASVAMIIALLRMAGGFYLAGIDSTTLARSPSVAPIPMVLQGSWDWTAPVVVLAAVAVAICLKAESSAPVRWLVVVLAGTALLVPLEQARIHTYDALSKHVDFGAWFAAIAAGYALDHIIGWARDRRIRIAIVSASVAGLAAIAASGVQQSNALFAWPGAANVIPVARRLTAHGGHFLADDVPTLEYYLPNTTTAEWSSVFDITLPSGRRVPEPTNSLAPYQALLARHYFTVIILSFSDKARLDRLIFAYLDTDPDYQILPSVRFSNPGSHYSYLIWVYRRAQ